MRDHPVAFWTGVTALGGNLLGIAGIKALGAESDTILQVMGSVVVSLLVALVAYGNQRLKDAREGNGRKPHEP